ncbi:MFS transporter [Nonomuraea rhizosphaerae]|uniref:MFS transporter n=1 Tax=Nonomuraea rhizosphaerae TaxID=2665663 RepID=UPI0027E3345E|nr:MFS transporter [Nonomuraea rhizosphaerae]
MTAVLEAPATISPSIGVRRPWLGLSAVLGATLMNLLDSTVVSVGGPAIQADLGGGAAALQWIAAGYTLALAVGLLTGGRLGDMFGRRRMLLLGTAGFVITSLACALAPTPEILIVARALQGLTGAVMIPQGFGLIRDLFPPAEQGKAFGAFGPVIGLATILGPVVAGLLVDADVLGTGWRMIFLINLPLGLYALIVGARTLPSAPARTRSTRLDLPGSLLAGAGMLLMIYPLVQGRELGWPAWSLVMLAASVPVFGLFGLYQVRRNRAGAATLIEPSVFGKRSFSSGVVFVIVFFGAVAGFGLAVGMFLQLGLGYSALRASLTMASWAVGAFLGTAFSAARMAVLGRRILHLGLAIMAVGITALYAVFQLAGASVGAWDLVLPLLAYGVGMGMIFVPLFGIIMGGVEDHEIGSASGTLEGIQQLGASLGIAVLGTVFFGQLGQAGHIGGHAVEAVRLGAVQAAGTVTLITLGLTALAFAVGFLLPRQAR